MCRREIVCPFLPLYRSFMCVIFLHWNFFSLCHGHVDELATEPFLLLRRKHRTGYRRSRNCCDWRTRFVVIWKHFCFILSSGTKIRIDSVMRPHSLGRGRNTSVSVTVTVTVCGDTWWSLLYLDQSSTSCDGQQRVHQSCWTARKVGTSTADICLFGL